MFVDGEELVYNVRYAFIDLGQVRIKVAGTERTTSGPAYRTIAYIDSYRGVPFVDLHAVYTSLIDSLVYARWFMGKVKENDSWRFEQYDFQYDRHRVLMDVGERDTVVTKRETLAVHTPMQDGLSLFYRARADLYSGKSEDIPTLIKEENVTTHIDFRNEESSVEVDAIDHPVDVIKFEGNAHFVGIFGLTGGFEGWFSNDAARVPIMAKMKVLIGSVTIELMKWKRPGWSPPRAKG